MPILPGTALTAGGLLVRLAESLGDLIHTGTTSTGSVTTAVDVSVNDVGVSNDDENLIGAWWYGISGTAANQERVSIAPYTASSGTITYNRSGTSPAGDTGYILTRRYRPTMLLRALQEAQRYQTQKMVSLLPVVGREIVIGSAIPNNFDLFTTANVPDGLTVDSNSTFTAGTTVTHGGRRALRMVTDGTNAGFVRYAIPLWGRYQSATARLKVMARASIASRVTAEINDGTGTATTDTLTTNNTWELLDASRAVNSAATQLRMSVEVTSGAAVTLDLAYWYAPEPRSWQHFYLIDADRSLVAIGDLRVSDTAISESGEGTYSFGLPLALKNWRVWEDTEDTPRKLELDISDNYQGRVLEYHGYKIHAELTGPTISYTGNTEMLLARARAIALRNMGTDAGMLQAAMNEADELESRLGVHIPLGYRRVQSQ